MKNSNFDASVWEYWIHSIISKGAIILTFGIATPWVTAWYEKWRCHHTIVEGKRLKFTGDGTNLIGKYLLWLLLSYITLGIYGFWLRYNMIQWVAVNTHFDD